MSYNIWIHQNQTVILLQLLISLLTSLFVSFIRSLCFLCVSNREPGIISMRIGTKTHTINKLDSVPLLFYRLSVCRATRRPRPSNENANEEVQEEGEVEEEEEDEQAVET